MEMAEEKITVECSQKKNLKGLASLMSGLGFTKIAYSKGALTIEKTKGSDLRGIPYLEYRVEFGSDSINFVYSVSAKRNKMARLMNLMPTFLNLLQVAEDYYDIQPTQMFSHINPVLAEVTKMLDRDVVEFSTQLSELQEKYGNLNRKYEDLVRSSEANTRILLECERKRDEQAKKLAQLSGMSDDLLKESLYEWLKVHGGSIDIREFSKANSVAISRAEEGLDLLIREGYIRRRL
jgi:predicted RNase H-like nuclease (RuvC/YqgF family)